MDSSLDTPPPPAENQQKSRKEYVHRTPAQRAADLVFIEQWALEGYQMRQMEDKLAAVRPYRLGFRSIWLEVRRLHKMWEQEAVAMVDANKNQMLGVLRKQEVELWTAWEKSKTEVTKQTLTKREGGTGGAKDMKSAVKVSAYGDPAIMRLILDVQRQKAELLGLNAAKKTELSGPNGGAIPVKTSALSPEELHAAVLSYAEEIKSETHGADDHPSEAATPVGAAATQQG